METLGIILLMALGFFIILIIIKKTRRKKKWIFKRERTGMPPKYLVQGSNQEFNTESEADIERRILNKKWKK